MENHVSQEEKELIALDADDHLPRPLSIPLTVSEMQWFSAPGDHVAARRPGFLSAA